MRDRRFVTLKRGGDLTPDEHRQMMLWACACIDHLVDTIGAELSPVLVETMHTAEAWAAGRATTGDAMTAARNVHAYARTLDDPVQIYLARAVGHAVATAHMADHCIGPVVYGKKAVEAAGGDAQAEQEWQLDLVPESIRPAIQTLLAAKKGL